MSWFVHWDPSFDLSRGGIELSFRVPNDMNHLLVRTDATRFADRIIDKAETLAVSPRYYVIGTRGFGKSTLLNYFAFRLFTELKSKLVLPVYTSLSGSAESEKDLDFVFFKSLLESLFDVPSDMQRFQLEKDFHEASDQLMRARLEYKKKLRDFVEVSLEYVSNALENQLEHLRNSFSKVMFLIDGLDKQRTEIVLKFLRSKQERLNNLITKYGVVFVDAADPDWRETLGTKEFGGVRGMAINLRGWTSEEVQLLIKNRLESITIFQNPFDPKALEVLVEDFQGNPREILQYCTTLLQYAASERTATIGPGLARKVIWNDASKEKFFNFVIGNADARYAFEKLKTVYGERQMMNILLAAYNQRTRRLSRNLDYEERSSIGVTLTDDDFKRFTDVLLTRGCLTSKTLNYVELHDDLMKLFDFVAGMDQSLIALPVVLGTLESRVEGVTTVPKEEIAFKEEVQRVFEQHPSKWLNYTKCKESLLGDPRTKGKLEEHFLEDFDRKISQTIPLIVNDLVNEGKLLYDEESSEYRWRSNLIDAEMAEFFKLKSVLDLIETSRQCVADGKFAYLPPLCEKLFWVSYTKLDNLLGGRFNTTIANEAVEFLRAMGVEVAKPMHLASFLKTMEEPLSNADEANFCIQTAILYVRRIFVKINELKQYEPENQKILAQLQKCKTGTSKEAERKHFRECMLPILLQNYGKLVECMSKIKTENGILEEIPPELNVLLEKKQFLPAQLYECPACKNQTAISANTQTGKPEVNFCIKDKVPYVYKKLVYILSHLAYQSWNVWMEEYAKDMLEKLPCRCVETGVVLKPMGMEGIASSEEVDAIAIFNGKSIAIECSEHISVNSEKNDIVDVIRKIESLGLFHHILLLYRSVDDVHALNAEARKHEKMVTPIMVGAPKNLRFLFFQALELLRNIDRSNETRTNRGINSFRKSFR